MRFQKGVHYPHPARGRARHPYDVTDAARRARRQNLSRSRQRSDRESAVIKLLVWQAMFDAGPHPTQRTLARLLGVQPSYVCKVQKQAAEGLEALTRGDRTTLEELAEARRFTAKFRIQEPHLLAAARRSERPVTSSREAISRPARVSGPKFPASDDPYGHAQGCPCRACAAKAKIEAALKRAAEAARR